MYGKGTKKPKNLIQNLGHAQLAYNFNFCYNVESLVAVSTTLHGYL